MRTLRIIFLCFLCHIVEARPLVEMMTWTQWAEFRTESNPASKSIVLLSPWVETSRPWMEAIPSWNVDASVPVGLKVELRSWSEGTESRWYHLGLWSIETNHFMRRSEPHQEDDRGRVMTDTFRVKQPSTRCQMRVTMFGQTNTSVLQMLSLCLSDPEVKSEELVAWRPAAAELSVPQLSQGNYPGGEKSWCSPTCLTMVLNYWGNQTGRDSLRKEVPEVAAGVFDPQWPGTGNWSFNVAYAGSFPTMRAFVTRFENLQQIEPWLAKGVPVVLSVSNPILKGLPEREGGHLVVCIGFTQEGEVILNDPGSKEQPRLVVPISIVEKAWNASGKTSYVIYPKSFKVPAWTATARVHGFN